MSEYKYPSKDQLNSDVTHESTAINVAIGTMSDALDNCPLSTNLQVYAAIELAFKLGDKAYVEEVFNEILLFKPNL